MTSSKLLTEEAVLAAFAACPNCKGVGYVATNGTSIVIHEYYVQGQGGSR